MASLSAFKPGSRLVKGLCVGYPGTGKTGSIASIANSGRYNLRVMNFDGSTAREVLLEYIKPEFYDRVEVVDLEDTLRLESDGTVSTVGPPRAFVTAAKLGSHWKQGKEGEDGYVDLGPIKSWGPDDVLVIDNLSRLNEAICRQIQFQQNRVGKPMRKQDWGAAVNLENGFLEILAGNNVPCHVLVLAHIVMSGPDMPDADDDDVTKNVKQQQSELVPWRLFPRGVTKNYSSLVASNFPYLFHYQQVSQGPNRIKRIINPFSIELDAKMPLKSISGALDISDGLVKILDAARNEPK